MIQTLQVVSFNGTFLERGFWLYVWEITAPKTRKLYYVGRTEDSSSQNAQSPFNRMSQHLSFNKKNNVLRRRLKAMDIEPINCAFRLFAYGPIMEESSTRDRHRACRDHVAAMEKTLADAMITAGYDVMNSISCRKQLDEKAFAIIRSAFGEHFAHLEKPRATDIHAGLRATV